MSTTAIYQLINQSEHKALQKLQQPDNEAQKVPCTGISQFHSVVSPACFRLPVRETNKRNRQVSLELTKKTGP